MWRLIRHPDDTICVGRNDEHESPSSEMIVIQMCERTPSVPCVQTLPLKILVPCELAISICNDSSLLFFNFFVALVTIWMIDMKTSYYPFAMSIHGMLMLSTFPIIVAERAFLDLILMSVHIMIYVVISIL